jgi:hypothetical protein
MVLAGMFMSQSVSADMSDDIREEMYEANNKEKYLTFS